jgi:hypothetical protein
MLIAGNTADVRGWREMKRFWLALATLLGLAVQAMPASAAFTWTYTLNCQVGPTCTGSNATKDFGTVQLLQVGTGTNAKIQVTVSLLNGWSFDNNNSSNNNYALAWSLNGNPDTTISNVTNHFVALNSGNNNHTYAASPFTTGSSCSLSSCFDYAIKDTGSSSTNDKTLVFDVTKSNGLAISSILNPFIADSAGFYFAAYIHKGDTSMFVGSNADPVPEPMTWTMSIAGLMGIAGFALLQNRRKLAKAA